MNKYLLCFFIIILWGCGEKRSKEKQPQLKIKLYDHYTDQKQIDDTIQKFVRLKQLDQASKLIDTLMYFNKENGFLYFEKGFLEGCGMHGEAAMRDYKIAEHLNYNEGECRKMMKATQYLINAGLK